MGQASPSPPTPNDTRRSRSGIGGRGSGVGGRGSIFGSHPFTLSPCHDTAGKPVGPGRRRAEALGYSYKGRLRGLIARPSRSLPAVSRHLSPCPLHPLTPSPCHPVILSSCHLVILSPTPTRRHSLAPIASVAGAPDSTTISMPSGR